MAAGFPGKAKTLANGQRPIFDPALGSKVESAIILRAALEAGDQVSGPAAITEDETTIILPSSRQAIRQSDGCIDVVRLEVTGIGSES